MTEQVNVLTHMAIESVIVNRPKEQIEQDLPRFGPTVQVVGWRMTEDGYELLLEGPSGEVADLIWFWGQEVFL
jgi:hypothetical protein